MSAPTHCSPRRNPRRLAAGAASAVLAALIGLPAAGVQAQAGGAGTHGSAVAPGAFKGAKTTVYPAWFKESFLELDADVTEAAEAGKRVMVFFHQDGCPYCNALVERNLAQRDIEQRLRKEFDVIEMNMWGDREVANVGGQVYTEKSFARALKVQFTPTLLFFNETGRIVLRLNGYLPPSQFRTALDYVAGRHEKSMSYRDYVRANRSSAASADLNAEPFFASPPHDLARVAGSGERPIAVFFEQRDCPDCDRLHREVLSAEESRAQIARYHAVQLDMWSDTPVTTPQGDATTARDWAGRLGVAYAPTLVLMDPAGNEIIRAEASFKQFHTQSLLDYVASGSYREEPSFQRYISERAEAIRERGVDVDIWK